MENSGKADSSIVKPEGEEMDQNMALNILVNAIHLGQTRGAWKLEEVPTLLKAIKCFTRKE